MSLLSQTDAVFKRLLSAAGTECQHFCVVYAGQLNQLPQSLTKRDCHYFPAFTFNFNAINMGNVCIKLCVPVTERCISSLMIIRYLMWLCHQHLYTLLVSCSFISIQTTLKQNTRASSSPSVLQADVQVIHSLRQYLVTCPWFNSMTSVVL